MTLQPKEIAEQAETIMKTSTRADVQALALLVAEMARGMDELMQALIARVTKDL